MTKDRIQSLNELGFDWGRRRYGPQVSWKERRQQLVDYKAQVGNTNVPYNYTKNKPLRNWVEKQRYQHKLYKEGKHSSMTKDRIKSLNELGFVWKIKERKKKKRSHRNNGMIS